MENKESKKENEPMEDILDVLESAFEKRVKVRLKVLEPHKELQTNEVFVEEYDNGVLYVSDSETSPVMEIWIDWIKSAELAE